MMEIVLYLILGLAAGISSGFFGIGGGIIIIPSLVLFFGLTQAQAQGTTIALLVLPIGILGAIEYFNKGLVNIKIAGFVALGLFFGALIGAKIAVNIPNDILQKIFGSLLLVVGAYMIFKK
jgi:uncharacterized membrane protein YfcA